MSQELPAVALLHPAAAKKALAGIEILLPVASASMVLLVWVSTVALPISVSVAEGRVIVPAAEADAVKLVEPLLFPNRVRIPWVEDCPTVRVEVVELVNVKVELPVWCTPSGLQ